jgi:threonine dehydrogenase-like Zn-dependent dehydrogenase
MLALWLEDRSLRIRDDVPRPSPPPGEALVRVRMAGICNTDLELVKGYYPFTGIPGHEFVGHVEAAPGHDGWVGRRVVGEINAACHTCATCRAGRPTHCERRTVLGIAGRQGAFAEYLTLPVENLHEVPPGLSHEAATFVEPTAAALEIQRQAPIQATDQVVVIGDGKLGQLVAQTLALTGCALTVVGHHAAKLALLSARGIATAHAEALAPRSSDLVVECTGNADGLALALRLVRPRGTVVLKSTYAGNTTLDVSALVVDEVTLLGSRCGPFAPAIDLLVRGLVAPLALVSARYPLVQGLDAFAHAARRGATKVLLVNGPL